jgi:hypothetical protein
MPESVVHEWKLACRIGGKFKHHAASGRHTERLYAVHRAIEANTIAAFYPDKRIMIRRDRERRRHTVA